MTIKGNDGVVITKKAAFLLNQNTCHDPFEVFVLAEGRLLGYQNINFFHKFCKMMMQKINKK